MVAVMVAVGGIAFGHSYVKFSAKGDNGEASTKGEVIFGSVMRSGMWMVLAAIACALLGIR